MKPAARSSRSGALAAPSILLLCLVLASCQTRVEEALEIGDAAEPGLSAPTQLTASNAGYTDPLVATSRSNAGDDDTMAVPAPSAAVLAAYSETPVAATEAATAMPTAGPANLGELTMQSTAVNAQANSLFSAVQAPAPTAVATGTHGASIVPADMPNRRFHAMSKSLFSGPPQAQIVDIPAAALPETEPRTARAGALPLTENEARAMATTPARSQVVASGTMPQALADASEPLPAADLVAVTDGAAKPKRKWLPSLPDLLRGGKSGS